MNVNVKEKEAERNVRYQIQMRPGNTRLIAEFKEGETRLLGKFIEILLNEGQPELTGGKESQIDVAGDAFAVVMREK